MTKIKFWNFPTRLPKRFTHKEMTMILRIWAAPQSRRLRCHIGWAGRRGLAEPALNLQRKARVLVKWLPVLAVAAGFVGGTARAESNCEVFGAFGDRVSYPILCRAPLPIGANVDQYDFSIYFKKSRISAGPNGLSLERGTCAWSDRPLNANEPAHLQSNILTDQGDVVAIWDIVSRCAGDVFGGCVIELCAHSGPAEGTLLFSEKFAVSHPHDLRSAIGRPSSIGRPDGFPGN
jgi:hypothetical protein